MRLDKGVEFVSDNKVLLFFRRNPIRASRRQKNLLKPLSWQRKNACCRPTAKSELQ